MDACELSAKHKIGFTTQGSICLFDSQQSMKLVAVCQKEGVLILGIESYIRKNGLFILQSNNIADFSSLAKGEREVSVRESCYSAATFIRQVSDSVVMFEFVLADS
jgi:hypothetical protein